MAEQLLNRYKRYSLDAIFWSQIAHPAIINLDAVFARLLTRNAKKKTQFGDNGNDGG
jgi:hypothetical protein